MGEDEKLKIFLAEDEYVVREGIKKQIDWASHGYEFVGEAADGELAYPMIQKEKPDIIVTDIKMPFMDGLELSRLVKKELPGTEIIILSGYEEFEYAREGIKIGVAEYLTKPISASDLLSGIDRVAVEIRKRREEEKLRIQYQKEMQEAVRLERKDLFKHLVSGDINTSGIYKMAEKVNVSITAVSYALLLLKFASDRHADIEFSGSILKIDDELEEKVLELSAVSFDRTPEGKAYLFMADSTDNLEKKISLFKATVETVSKDYKGISYFGAIGSRVGRISEIPTSYDVAAKAFAYRFFEKESRFVDGCDVKETPEINKDSFSVGDVEPGRLNRGDIERFLKTGIKEEAGYFVEAFFAELGENALNSNMFRQYLAMDSFYAVAEFTELVGGSKEDVETFGANSEILKSVSQTKEYIIRICENAIEFRDHQAGSRYDKLVEDIYAFVEENYGDEALSLNMIAAKVNFSPSHLSMIFSQETGQTLIRYITDVRMNKAKDLLRCTSKRSVEISRLCGYQDPHYFSYLFKKTQGCTPTEYRGGKDAEENV